MFDQVKKPIPTVRQVDKQDVSSAVRLGLVAAWEHAPLGDDAYYAGAMMMASVLCRSVGLDVNVLNREAARLAAAARRDAEAGR